MRRVGWLLSLLAVLACSAEPRVTTPAPTESAPGEARVTAVRTVSASPDATVASSNVVPDVPDPDWLTYQHDPGRSGQAGTAIDAAKTKLVWESDELDGDAYAQVLISADRVFAVTENNTVYALAFASGKMLWTQHLGDPVPRSSLPCGNIDPTGMTGTPTIDPAAELLYVVDYLSQPPHHELAALELFGGVVRFHQPIDPIDANPLPLQQRAALTLSNGVVYVPFGGLLGDCGDYHGWVVSAGATNGFRRGVYQVQSHRAGAIWAAPALDAAGDLYVATGNTDSTTDFDQSNSVLRLSSNLQLLDLFAPGDWADLNRRDADLGSSGPVHGPLFNSGAPTLTEDAVWTVDNDTTSLYALSRTDGHVLFRGPAGQASNPPHFLTPAAAGGRIFHSRGRTIVAYGSS
ncbi:MAG: PQQ-like beta-propeller repeat protein [Chloroflexi bacterium]|nr:PQQ-like beta-propeller repeat protein [Chloroflexota bacterium]